VSSGCTRLTNEDVGELYGRAQDEIRRLAGNGNALHPEAASSISSGLSIVGKIIGHGALTIFGRVEGEVRASIVVVAEGAEMVGEVVAEELTVGGQLKGTIHANRVRLNGTGVVGGIFSIAHWRSKRMLGPRRAAPGVADRSARAPFGVVKKTATSLE
jgi:hypothetical protein